MFFYPKELSDLKEKDKYQILHIMAKQWSEIKEYKSNICSSKQEDLKFLIKNKRIRVIK